MARIKKKLLKAESSGTEGPSSCESWQDYLGFSTLEAQAMSWLGRWPPVLLLTGPEGLGKATFIKALAALHYCKEAHKGACGQCQACLEIRQETHPEVLSWRLEAQSKKLEDLEQIQRHIQLRPSPLNWSQAWVSGALRERPKFRAVLISDIDRLSVQAMNRLLKTLEEPPPDSIFILSSSRPQLLLETVRSRTFQWELRPPDRALYMDWLGQNFSELLAEVDPWELEVYADRLPGPLKALSIKPKPAPWVYFKAILAGLTGLEPYRAWEEVEQLCQLKEQPTPTEIAECIEKAVYVAYRKIWPHNAHRDLWLRIQRLRALARTLRGYQLRSRAPLSKPLISQALVFGLSLEKDYI